LARKKADRSIGKLLFSGLKSHFLRILEKSKRHSEELKSVALDEHMITMEEFQNGRCSLTLSDPIARDLEITSGTTRVPAR
jgi:hypothetical protein